MPKESISLKKQEKIYEAHKLGMSTHEAAEYAEVSRYTVKNYWDDAGLKPHYKPGCRISSEKEEKIYKAHKLGMRTLEAAEYAGVSQRTVQNYWNNAGLKPHYNPCSRISSEKEEKIYKAHKLGMRTLEAAEYAGVSQRTVQNYWNNAGLKPHYNPCSRISLEKEEKIYEAHELGMSLHQAAKYAGVGDQTVKNYWKKKGLMPHGKQKGYWSTDNVDKAFDELEKALGRIPTHKDFLHAYPGARVAITNGHYSPDIKTYTQYLLYRLENGLFGRFANQILPDLKEQLEHYTSDSVHLRS